MGEGLADVDRRPVHVLHRDRDDAGADDRRDAGAGVLDGVEAHQRRARALGGAQDAHHRLGDDAELALGAADEAEEVVARGCRDAPPPISTTVPSISTMRDAEEVVGGHAVLQAVRAARVHRDVAGDGAGELEDGSGA